MSPAGAAVISRALRREQRRRRAERDLLVILGSGGEPDLAGVSEWAGQGQDFAGIDERGRSTLPSRTGPGRCSC